jgi:hypothetical protein
MKDSLVDGLDAHLTTLVGKRLTFPGGKGIPFDVRSVEGDTVQVVGSGQTIGIKKEWLREAFRVLVVRKALTRSGISGQLAQYRSGYIFAILATHPSVVLAKPFPTKLTLK